MQTYALEIYLAGSTSDVLASFESDSPFQSIARGDLLAAGAWGGSGYKTGDLLLVTAVEHIVFDSKPRPKHKICVYTREVVDTQDARRGEE